MDLAASHLSRGSSLGRLHGLFNVVAGVWPLVDMRSFEAVSGPKVDTWLVRTVAGLMVVNGLTQITAPSTPEGLATSRRLGIGTALTLAAVDLRYGSTGRIRRVYLLDAVVEAGWVAAWLATLRPRRARRADRAGYCSRSSSSRPVLTS
jgi:hypothetical protein